MRAASVLLASLLFGCSDDAPSSTSTPAGRSDADAPHVDAAKGCAPGHAAAHRERYAGLCRGDVELASDRLAPIQGSASDGSALEGVRIVVTTVGVDSPGTPAIAPAEIEAEVARQIGSAQQKAADEGKPPPTRFVLEIDREAPMTVVDDTARALIAAGFAEGVFALAADEPSPAPVHPEIHRRLAPTIEGLDPADRATTIAREIEKLVGDCTAVAEAFSLVATHAPHERCKALTNALPDAFVACGCPATEPEIMTLIQVVYGMDTRYVHAQPVRLVLSPTPFDREEKLWGELVASRGNGLAKLEIPARQR